MQLPKISDTWWALSWMQMKEIDAKRRDILVKVESLAAERNTVSAEIAKLAK